MQIRTILTVVAVVGVSGWMAAGAQKKPATPAVKPASTAYGNPVLLGNLEDKEIVECSGIAVGRRNPGVLWVHNDSGDGPWIFATDKTGKALAKFNVTSATNVDWEDIATGLGEGDNATLYIGDIGDNNRNREDTAVYRIYEPQVDMNAKTRLVGQTMVAEKFPFRYPDGKHDAETMMVHPTTGEIYIVAKEESGVDGVYKFPMPLTRNRQVTLEKVTTVTFSNPISFRGRAVGKLTTAGDISPDGKKVVIRTYAEAFEWSIAPGQKVEEALATKPRLVSVPWLGQFEAICYTADSKSLLTCPESKPCPLWEVPRK